MKIFIYKTLIVIFAVYLLLQFTVGLKIREYEKKIESANQKENIFTSEERELLSNFINKIQKELSVDKSQ